MGIFGLAGDVYLKTQRVTLREFSAADEDKIFELDSDPEVMRYLTGGEPSTRGGAKANLERILSLTAKYEGRFGCWAASENEAQTFMGWFLFRPGKEAPENLKRVEFGYRLKRFFWSQGYATEVSKALIVKGFEELGVETVFALAEKENLASRRVMEKCGLHFLREYPEVVLGRKRVTVEYEMGRVGNCTLE